MPPHSSEEEPFPTAIIISVSFLQLACKEIKLFGVWIDDKGFGKECFGNRCLQKRSYGPATESATKSNYRLPLQLQRLRDSSQLKTFFDCF